MNCKAAETTHNNAFGPGTANECTVQWWFKKITALKMRSGVASHQLVSVDYNQLRAIIQAGPLTTMWETVEELNFNNSMVLGIWSILESWKILVSGWMSWLKIKKIVVFKCHHLLLYATMKSNFSIRLWHVTKSGFYTTTNNDQLRAWTAKKLQSTSKAKLASKQGHGHCLVVCCRPDPLQF